MTNVVSTDDAAEILGVRTVTIRQLVFRGELTPVRPGARPLHFDEDQVWQLQYSRSSRAERERRRHLAAQWAELLVADDQCVTMGAVAEPCPDGA